MYKIDKLLGYIVQHREYSHYFAIMECQIIWGHILKPSQFALWSKIICIIPTFKIQSLSPDSLHKFDLIAASGSGLRPKTSLQKGTRAPWISFLGCISSGVVSLNFNMCELK